MVRSAPAPSVMPSLVNVQREMRTRAELSAAKLRLLHRTKRLRSQLGLRANTDIVPKAIITYFAFAPTIYASTQAAFDAGYKYYYKHKGGYVAMLNPCPSLKTSNHRGVYCNHASKGSALANASMSVLRPVEGIIANQLVGFEATLSAKARPIKVKTYVRTSYGPQYASKFSAATAAQFEARTGKNRNLKIGRRFPPAQEQAQLEAQKVTRDLKKAAQIVKEKAFKATRQPSKRALPERPDRGKLKPQRWQ